jgi:hypothetical protein
MMVTLVEFDATYQLIYYADSSILGSIIGPLNYNPTTDYQLTLHLLTDSLVSVAYQSMSYDQLYIVPVGIYY